jgi:hypothetical protein
MEDKPVELMNDEEREAYYRKRREAILGNDDSVMPDGRTVRETREDYARLSEEDVTRTLPDITTRIMEESEIPDDMVVEGDPSQPGERCC